MKLETLLAHAAEYGGINDPHGASHFPVYQTATFNLKKQKGDKHYDYTRSGNPTRESLETVFALAEGAEGCVCTHTGVGAVALLFEVCLNAGSQILVENDCYGGTFRLLKVYKEKYNVEVIFADFSNFTEFENILKSQKIDLILCESPTNPGLKILNIKRLSDIAKSYKTKFAVDNSLATFASQQPLLLGADFSLFSLTKYVSGHGSVIAGVLAAKNSEDMQKIRFYANAEGRALNPFDVYIISLGLATLPIRMKQHEQSALILAERFQKLSKIKSVRYPGLKNHEEHELAKSQMKYMTGVLTIDCDSVETAETLVANTKFFGEKASFGAADSRMEIPAKISHASFSEEELANIGIYPSTIRISVGLEDVDDLWNDILQALS